MIVGFQTTCVAVAEASQIGEARREAQALAGDLGLGEVEVGRAGIVATEAATNLVLHANGGGVLLMQPTADAGGIEIISVDRGPGIHDLARCLQDGYSSAGTAGHGLGAIRRQCDTFEVHSERSQGTVLLGIVRPPRPRPSAAAEFEVGAICVRKHGEEVCGDLWSSRREPVGCAFVVADGLGHGLGAAEAARSAVKTFEDEYARGPGGCLDRIHGALRATRGAAAAVAQVDRAKGIVRYAGIGNIAASIINGEGSRSLISYNGILGHGIYKLQELSYPWPQGAMLVMHSDGLSTHWDLRRYPGVRSRHPSLIAALLYRDFARERDDVTVVVAREVPS